MGSPRESTAVGRNSTKDNRDACKWKSKRCASAVVVLECLNERDYDFVVVRTNSPNDEFQ